MRRSWMLPLALLAVGLGLLAGRGRQARAAEEDFAGTWKVTAFVQDRQNGPRELGLWLVKIEGKGAKAKGTLVSTVGAFKSATVEKVAIDANALRFVLKAKGGDFAFIAHAPKAKGKDKPKALFGALVLNEQRLPARFDRSALKEIDEKKAAGPLDNLEDLEKALDAKTEKERDKALMALLDKVADKPLGYYLSQGVMQNKIGDDGTAAEVRTRAERHARIAAAYGRELELHAYFTGARMVAQSGKAPELAEELGQKAVGLLRDTDPPVYATNVLRLQLRSLWNAGKADQAKAVAARLVKFAGGYNQEMVARAQEQVKAGGEKLPAPQRATLLKVLASAYRVAGKEGEAKKVEADVAKAQQEIDAGNLKDLQDKYKGLKESKESTAEERLTVARALARALGKVGKGAEAKKLTAEIAPLETAQAKKALAGAQKGLAEMEKEPPARDREAVLKALSRALKRNGKVDEARKIDADLVKVTQEVNEAFAKKAVPFKVEPFAGRKAKSDRVALVELFTGAQCPPCVAADVAFDALLKRYKPSDVVLLQYHLHVPRPDPLTNVDTVARSEYYEDDVGGCPTGFVNGDLTPSLGGTKAQAEDRYGKLTKQIERQLETRAQAEVKLRAERKGGKIELEAQVTDLTGASENLRLRFVLVEDVVGYYGKNRQRLHHHVVRAMPGGAEGQLVKGKSATLKASVDVEGLRKSIAEYLESFSDQTGGLDEDRPLALKNLKVVAFVQDDTTREVLQAVQVEVPAAK